VNTDLGGKEQWKWCVFYLLRKRDVERSETSEFNVGEGVTWWATWRRSNGRLFHKTVAEWKKDLFTVLRWEMREGQLSEEDWVE